MMLYEYLDKTENPYLHSIMCDASASVPVSTTGTRQGQGVRRESSHFHSIAE